MGFVLHDPHLSHLVSVSPCHPPSGPGHRRSFVEHFRLPPPLPPLSASPNARPPTLVLTSSWLLEKTGIILSSYPTHSLHLITVVIVTSNFSQSNPRHPPFDFPTRLPTHSRNHSFQRDSAGPRLLPSFLPRLYHQKTQLSCATGASSGHAFLSAASSRYPISLSTTCYSHCPLAA